IGIRIDTGLFPCHPAIDAPPRGLSRDEPRLPPVAPTSAWKGFAKPLHRHPVERKRDGGALVILHGVLANVITSTIIFVFQLRFSRNARQLEKMQRIKGIIESRKRRGDDRLSY